MLNTHLYGHSVHFACCSVCLPPLLLLLQAQHPEAQFRPALQLLLNKLKALSVVSLWVYCIAPRVVRRVC
jgi:hypothetical protein